MTLVNCIEIDIQDMKEQTDPAPSQDVLLLLQGDFYIMLASLDLSLPLNSQRFRERNIFPATVSLPL